MAARAKTLSKLPPAPKPVKVEPDPRSYRSRPTLPGPFGDEEPPFEGPLPEVLERAAVDTEAGMAPVIEYRLPGLPWMPWRRPVLVQDLHRLGLAHERTDSWTDAGGKKRSRSFWVIDPEGQRMIYDAMGVPGGAE